MVKDSRQKSRRDIFFLFSEILRFAGEQVFSVLCSSSNNEYKTTCTLFNVTITAGDIICKNRLIETFDLRHLRLEFLKRPFLSMRYATRNRSRTSGNNDNEFRNSQEVQNQDFPRLKDSGNFSLIVNLKHDFQITSRQSTTVRLIFAFSFRRGLLFFKQRKKRVQLEISPTTQGQLVPRTYACAQRKANCYFCRIFLQEARKLRLTIGVPAAVDWAASVGRVCLKAAEVCRANLADHRAGCPSPLNRENRANNGTADEPETRRRHGEGGEQTRTAKKSHTEIDETENGQKLTFARELRTGDRCFETCIKI